MHNELLQDRIQRLEEKIHQLLHRHNSLQEAMQQNNRERKQLMPSSSIGLPAASYTLASKTDTGVQHRMAAWRAEIDGYISDIDKIIAHFEHLPRWKSWP